MELRTIDVINKHKKAKLSIFWAIFYVLPLSAAFLVSSPSVASSIAPLLTQVNSIAFAKQDQKDVDRLLKLGQEQLDRKEFQGAVESFQQALQIAQQLKEQDLITQAEIGLGQASLLAGNYPQAIQLFEGILPKERARGSGYEPTLSNLGLALFLSGKNQEAEKVLREAIAGWESIRATENSDLNKITLFEQQAYTYRLLQKVLVAQQKTDAALEVAEASRSRALVERLVQSSRPLPPPSINQIKQIAKTHNTTLVQYSIVGNEVRVLGNEPEDQTDLFIWVIKPTGEIEFRQVNLRQRQIESLTQQVLQTREQAIGVRGRSIAVTARNTNTNGRGNQIQLQQFYQLLIQPIADLLPTDSNARVTFIPQGALFLVPFAALQDSYGKYLIKKHTIITAPSIQVLDLTRQIRQRNTTGGNFLIVGNPRMPSIPGQNNNPPQQLPALPGAEQEAVAIASILNTQAFTGERANKKVILQQLANARIIHLATHGLLDLDANLNEFGEPLIAVRTARQSNVIVRPGSVIIGSNVTVGNVPAELSLAREKVVRVAMPGAIALAPSANDNGFLTAKEIAGMTLNAELVVLSACDTGRGRVTGDGVVGLSRAFIAGGVPSVIVSLWAVPDAPTANLMSDFYRNLQQKQDKAQALRQAMLATMKEHPNPKDWAAFTLIGEAD